MDLNKYYEMTQSAFTDQVSLLGAFVQIIIIFKIDTARRRSSSQAVWCQWLCWCSHHHHHHHCHHHYRHHNGDIRLVVRFSLHKDRSELGRSPQTIIMFGCDLWLGLLFVCRWRLLLWVCRVVFTALVVCHFRCNLCTYTYGGWDG